MIPSPPPPPSGRPPFDLLGGTAVVNRLAENFYDLMEAHEPALARLHECDADGRVARRSRDAFAMFLRFWLGGPRDYLDLHGHPRLRMRHGHLPVDAGMRDAWLRCMRSALDAQQVTGEVRTFLDERFSQVAEHLRNRAE